MVHCLLHMCYGRYPHSKATTASSLLKTDAKCQILVICRLQASNLLETRNSRMPQRTAGDIQYIYCPNNDPIVQGLETFEMLVPHTACMAENANEINLHQVHQIKLHTYGHILLKVCPNTVRWYCAYQDRWCAGLKLCQCPGRLGVGRQCPSAHLHSFRTSSSEWHELLSS